MRKGTLAIITNSKNEYFLMQRPLDHHTFPGQWTMPGGKVDTITLPGAPANYVEESIESAAYRECVEECGIKMRAFKQLDVFLTDDKFVAYTFYSLHSHEQDEVTVAFPNREHIKSGWFSRAKLPKGISKMTLEAIYEYETNGIFRTKRAKQI